MIAERGKPALPFGLVPEPTGPLRIGGSPAAGHALPVMFSLVVPTYNEAANIVPFLNAIKETLDPLMSRNYEVLVVDDDSEDSTWKLALALTPSFPQLCVMRRTQERELSTAVIRGWQAARGMVFGTINADFQHPPLLLSQMLDRIGAADLVVASRFARVGQTKEWGMRRRFVACLARQIGRWLVPQVFRRVSDPLSGFFLVKRDVLEGIEFRPSGFKTLIEILARAKVYSVEEFGYTMQRRREGRSKLSVRNCLRFLIHLRRIRLAVRTGTV